MRRAKKLLCEPTRAARRPTPWVAGLLVILIGAASWSSAAEDPTKATTSRTARDEAVKSIPYKKLDKAAQSKVAAVLNNTSIYRRLPLQVIDSDPNLYLFLVRHPEVIVDIWRLMGITEMQLERTGEVTFNANDGVGTTGKMEFLYGDHETHLIYCEGSYAGPLTTQPIRTRCLLVLKTGYIKRRDGRYLVSNRMDAFVDVENAGVELLARTFQNVFGKTADANFGETALFISKLSRTAESNSPGLERMATRLVALDPVIRKQFVEHATEVAERANNRAKPTQVAEQQHAPVSSRRTDAPRR